MRRARSAALAAAMLAAPLAMAGAQQWPDTVASGRPDSIPVPAAATVPGVAPSGVTQDSAATMGALATSIRTSPRGTLRLEVNLSERRLYVRDDDGVMAEYDVAVGKPGHRTPAGSFTIEKLIWNPGWIPPDSRWARGKTAKSPGDPGNPMKVVKIFFKEPDYYIHGTGATESLGEAASHGCLRMSPAEAAELARMIMEYGGEARDDLWYSEVLEDGDTRVVRLERPVEMVVRE